MDAECVHAQSTTVGCVDRTTNAAANVKISVSLQKKFILVVAAVVHTQTRTTAMTTINTAVVQRQDTMNHLSQLPPGEPRIQAIRNDNAMIPGELPH